MTWSDQLPVCFYYVGYIHYWIWLFNNGIIRIQNTFSSKVDDSCASHLKAYNELCVFFPSPLIGTFSTYLACAVGYWFKYNNNHNRDAVQWMISYALERVLLCCCDVLFVCQRRCLSAAVFRRYANLFSSCRKNMSGKMFLQLLLCAAGLFSLTLSWSI